TATSFFFQAEDVIRDFHVTGVQTCALPILASTQVPGTSMQAGYPGCVMSGTSVDVLLLEPRSTSPPLQMVLWPSWLCTVAEPEITTAPRAMMGFPGTLGSALRVTRFWLMVRVALRSSEKPCETMRMRVMLPDTFVTLTVTDALPIAMVLVSPTPS